MCCTKQAGPVDDVTCIGHMTASGKKRGYSTTIFLKMPSYAMEPGISGLIQLLADGTSPT